MKIKIRIPSYEISVPYEKVKFKYIEEIVLGVLKEIGKKVMRDVIAVVDEIEFKGHEKGLESTGKKGSSKYIETVFGIIPCIRRRYKDKINGGYRYLTDEKLGLHKKATESPGKVKRQIEAAVESRSYRQASKEEDPFRTLL